MMGRISCQDGKGDEIAAVLADMVEAARDEPGVEIYDDGVALAPTLRST